MPLVDALLNDDLDLSVLEPPLKEVWLAIRPDLAPVPLPVDPGQYRPLGAGTRSNPYDASTAEKLDAVLEKTVGPDTTVHFGPGIFRTKGRSLQTLTGWEVKSGQRFRGAGIYQTTIRLQLVPGDYGLNDAQRSFIAFVGASGTFLEGVEISDLTIDLNLQGQPAPTSGSLSYPRIMAAAINLTGSNIKISRVRVINFGTRTPLVINGAPTSSSAECFPIAVGGTIGSTASFSNQIEKCVIEQPYISNARETTCLLLQMFNEAAPATRNEGIRRNYLNCEYSNPSPAPAVHVKNIFRAPGSGVITFETDYPHNVGNGEFIEISGSTNTAYNKRLQISAAISPSDGSSRVLQVNYGADPGPPAGGYIMLQQKSLPRTIHSCPAGASGRSYSPTGIQNLAQRLVRGTRTYPGYPAQKHLNPKVGCRNHPSIPMARVLPRYRSILPPRRACQSTSLLYARLMNGSNRARGIVVAGSGTSMNFLQLIARKNVIRDVTYPSGVTSGMVGLNIVNIEQAVVEDNVINNCATTTALIFNSTKVQSMKSFNNQNTAGALMRAYDAASSRSIPELADAAQDSLMAF